MSFFQKSWLRLKMHASGRFFDKICLKAIKIFFSDTSSVIRWQVDSIFWWRWYSTERESSNFLACRDTPPPQFLFLEGHPDLPITLSAYCNDFEKSESIFFQINEVENSLIWHSIYWRLSIHFKIRSINET